MTHDPIPTKKLDRLKLLKKWYELGMQTDWLYSNYKDKWLKEKTFTKKELEEFINN